MTKYRFHLYNENIKTNDYPDDLKAYDYKIDNKDVGELFDYFGIDLDQFKDGRFPPLFETVAMRTTQDFWYKRELLDFKFDLGSFAINLEGVLAGDTVKFNSVSYTTTSFHFYVLKDLLMYLQKEKQKVMKRYQTYNDPAYIKKIIDGVAKKEKKLSLILKEPSST